MMTGDLNVSIERLPLALPATQREGGVLFGSGTATGIGGLILVVTGLTNVKNMKWHKFRSQFISAGK